MSTSPVLVPVSLVSQFLATEKIESRRWLQCQMECLLDQVFDQLSTKFEDYLASNAITGTAHHTTIDSDPIQHQHQPLIQVHSHPQFQTTTDQFINSEYPVAVGQTQNGGYRGDEMDSNRQTNPDGYDSEALMYHKEQYPPPLSVQTSNKELSNQNDTNEEYSLDGDNQSLDDDIEDNAAQMDSDEPEVKKEFDDTNNELNTSNQMSQSNSSLSPSPPNEQSSLYLIKCEDDEDCDCDECLNGIEVNEFDGGDDGDDGQFIEDNDEPSRPAKIPRMDTTESDNRHSLVTRVSSRLVSINQTEQIEYNIESTVFVGMQPTEEADETNQVNNQDKQIITISLQCLETDCPLMFNNKTELNHHMRTQHQILQFRCLVKDCKQSFSNQTNLSRHTKQFHPHTTEWHCDKCPKHFLSYSNLCIHNHHYHQLGQFKCSLANCTFTGGHRKQVFAHYRDRHITVDLICQHDDCGRRFNDRCNFRKHKRVHLEIKPYRCKWSSCGYAARHKNNTIKHIKRMHLNKSSPEASLVDPQEYLEVVR